MSKSVFNPEKQEKDLTSKIIASFERVSEAFKVLLWEEGKALGLSPIQIQVLIFVAYHRSELCKVSHLAKEFNVTKATLSDVIRALDKKKLIVKDFSSADSRSYSILLSEKGKKTVEQTENFANPIKEQLADLGEVELQSMYKLLSNLIFGLNQKGILSVQRTCFACKFYKQKGSIHYCNLLESELQDSQIRIDCPEFEDQI